METLLVEANGLTFRGITAGPSDGQPVLLLHGFPQTSQQWNKQLEALGNAGYRAVAFDQRGYSPGARTSEVSDYEISHLVDDVLAVASALGMQRFDLVGHDWGGMVAWAVAANSPDRLKTVTVVSTPHPLALRKALSDDSGDQQNRSSYIHVFRQVGVAENALLGEDGSGAGLRTLFAASGFASEDSEVFVQAMIEPGALTAALNWYRANLGEEIQDSLNVGQITIPTMYIWSTDDIALGRAAAEDTANYVSGPYRFEVLEGVSHWVTEMAPTEVNRLLLDFLGS
jgi:pimeloyl-ACP methyl ester carboxylesterase